MKAIREVNLCDVCESIQNRLTRIEMNWKGANTESETLEVCDECIKHIEWLYNDKKEKEKGTPLRRFIFKYLLGDINKKTSEK